MKWIVLRTGKRKASENMALDAALLQDVGQVQLPILHLYEWEEDSATYGHFVTPSDFLNGESVEKLGLDLAKRPTGGGIVFHLSDLAFSVLVPAGHPSFSLNPLENYAFVNRHVIWAIEQFLNKNRLKPTLLPEEPLPLDGNCANFCMAKPTKYDVMLEGKKVGGAAQRKTRDGYLHQGSIALGMLSDEYLSTLLKPGTRVLEGMKQNSYSLLGKDWDLQTLSVARETLSSLLEQAFTGSLS